MQGGAVFERPRIVDIIGVGRPHEIVDVGRLQMPGQGLALGAYPGAGLLVAVPDFLRVLQVSRAPHHIVLVDGQLQVKIPPNPVEFPGDIRIGMPAFKIVFGQFGVPLAHG